MSERRTHSSIDELPQGMREAINAMIVDGEWPEGWARPDDAKGKPRYEDIVAYAASQGQGLSLSAVGRYAVKMRTFARLRSSQLITTQVMNDRTDEYAGQVQKAAMELLTAYSIDYIATHDLTPREARDFATTVRDCQGVILNVDRYRREQTAAKVKEVDEKITEIAAKRRIDPETLKLIKEQIYGIVEKKPEAAA